MPSHFPRRRSAAGCLLLLACLAAAFAPSAHAAGGVYTHVLCANPDTGRGVAQDAQLPAGVTSSLPHENQKVGVSLTRCGRDRLITGDDGILLTTGTGYTTTKSYWGPYLRYRVPAGIAFDGATLYRSGRVGSAWAWSLIPGDTDEHTTLPRWDACWQNFGCRARGVRTDPFASANLVEEGAVPATPSGGFTLKVACHINNDPGHSCTADESGVRIYGGRVTLRDSTPPALADATGALASDAALSGEADFGIAASDGGAGVYRVIVRVDGTDRLVQSAGSNGGHCADVNPANDDPFEFALAQPCAPATDALHAFDTTKLPDGEHRLVVQVEDAAGNRATAINRAVVIDNVAPPVAVAAPAVSGAPRRGNQLVVTPAGFDDHGAPGDVAVARRWLRCRADGSACGVIAGVDGIAYTLGDDDLNRVVKVVETATNSEGQAVTESVATALVTREDGTLPPDNDGRDNDGDGVVDEPGETNPGPPVPGISGSSIGARGLDGLNGADARGVSLASTGQLNGDGASSRARLSAAFGASARGVVAYGRSLVARGRLVDESGRAIRGAVVDVAETAATRGARPVAGPAVVTDADGVFTYVASSRPGSRTVTFSYRHVRGGAVTAQAQAALVVRAGVRLSVRLKGIVVAYSGRVLAGSMPRGGKLVVVQGRAKGASWQTFATRRAGRTGTFKGRYRLKVRRPGKKLQFRVRVLSESGWNYGGVTSKAVTRTVR